ncbi:MAG: tetratricopeptide repeat protein [Acidobacteriota bacterium]
MNKVWRTLAVLMIAGLAYAQTTGRLTGVIKAKGGSPLQGAEVKITSKDSSKIHFTVKTDKNGVYSQIGLKPGDYIIEVALDGYLPQSAEWHVGLSTVTLDFELPEIPKMSVATAGPGAADFKKAQELFDAGTYEEAVGTLDRALAAEPSNPVYLAKLGFCYQRLAKPADSEAAFAKMVQADPSSFAGWFNLGVARMAQKNYAGAGEAFEQATKINPGDAEAFFNLGASRFNDFKIPEAVAAFERATQIKPDHALAHYHLANGYVNLGKIPEAKAEFEKFLQLAPPNDPLVPQAKAILDALQKM